MRGCVCGGDLSDWLGRDALRDVDEMAVLADAVKVGPVIEVGELPRLEADGVHDLVGVAEGEFSVVGPFFALSVCLLHFLVLSSEDDLLREVILFDVQQLNVVQCILGRILVGRADFPGHFFQFGLDEFLLLLDLGLVEHGLHEDFLLLALALLRQVAESLGDGRLELQLAPDIHSRGSLAAPAIRGRGLQVVGDVGVSDLPVLLEVAAQGIQLRTQGGVLACTGLCHFPGGRAQLS